MAARRQLKFWVANSAKEGAMREKGEGGTEHRDGPAETGPGQVRVCRGDEGFD